ncbi:uncharacterized protein [Lolium perenne]|uniref:uncharacterized protein n=1 Tax=Lolium perenne TaxID=4522 RepID=UPI003A9A079B
MVWLLDEEYDRMHRAVHMTERGTDLHPLKIRYHGTADIPYDERYTEFIRPTGLMPFISLQMEALIGRAPPLPTEPKKRVPAGASFEWIRTNFGECPEEADVDTRRTYARVYLWYMISRTLFPDSGGKLAHWCWLKALTVLDDRWSWGTAALAYLYRQLDEACRRTGSRTGSGGIGGCMLLLSVWSWDRLSVGRPRVLTEMPWPHHPHFPDREPTWAYLWDNVSEMTSDPMVMYRQYTAELDTLTAEQAAQPAESLDEEEAVEYDHTEETAEVVEMAEAGENELEVACFSLNLEEQCIPFAVEQWYDIADRRLHGCVPNFYVQLTRTALCDIIHGVARSQHLLIITCFELELRGSHTAFSGLRLLRVDSRIFMLPLRSLDGKYFVNLGSKEAH